MSRSTYRHQKTRHPSNRDVRRILLADTITELHLTSRSTYGVRRMRAALFHDRGLVVNRKLIRRIMVEHGLSGLPTRKKGRRNLLNVATSEDLVNRNFAAPAPNALWLTDIERHEALLNREEVQDPLLQPVAAGW
jgi:transposase InsO family protein